MTPVQPGRTLSALSYSRRSRSNQGALLTTRRDEAARQYKARAARRLVC